MPHVHDFPASLVNIQEIDGQQMKSVNGLGSALVQCYDQAILPSEHGALAWSSPGQVINMVSSRWAVEAEPESTPTPALADVVAK